MEAIPTRPALRYFGGKWRLAPWIISHFPPHDCYVEPFCGSGSVLFRRRPAPIEVLNDLDGEIVNFFRVLREHADELIRLIELTPFARAEFDLAHEIADDPIERARRLFVRAWQARGGPRTQWRSGWRFCRSISTRNTTAIDDWNNVERLWALAARLKHVQIEHDDALAVIQRYDTADTLFYCDPPYVADVREERWHNKAYHHEMTDDDHRRLADVLHAVQGPVLLSGYQGDLYAELYDGWTMVSHVEHTDTASARTECLWISPVAYRARPHLFAWSD